MEIINKEKDIEFWDLEDTERLMHEDKDEAIESFLDGLDNDELPEEIEICGFSRRDVKLNPNYLLNYILETIDSNYGGEDELEQPESEMLELTKKYISEIEKIAISYQCEMVCKEKINVSDWIRTNCPEWLEERI